MAAGTTTDLRIRLLGPITVRGAAGIISVHGTKILTLLVTLALAESRPVEDSRLCYYLWGEDPPATQTAQLYTYVSRLRGRLGSYLPIVRHVSSYRLDIDPNEVDGYRFRQLAHRGHELLAKHEAAAAAEVLKDALELWRGPAMIGVTENLRKVAGDALEDLQLTVIEDRAEALLILGRHRELTFELPPLVAENLSRERLRAHLMIALCRSDRQSDALRLYHNGRSELAEEMGVEPGGYLNYVYMTVLKGEVA